MAMLNNQMVDQIPWYQGTIVFVGGPTSPQKMLVKPGWLQHKDGKG